MYYQEETLFPEDDVNRVDRKQQTSFADTSRSQVNDVNRLRFEHQIQIGTSSRALVTGDWERGVGWYFYDGENIYTMSKEDFLKGKLFYGNPGCRLGIESAHLHERQPKSTAQVYERGELENILAIAKQNDVLIYAFPQKLSPRARKEIGGVGKEDDMKAIYHFVVNHPEVPLMKWGKFIGVKGVRGVIQLSPYHFKSGTARSNLMWHRLRNALHEKDEGRKPAERREFSHAVTDLIQAFRDSDRLHLNSSSIG